ncbi:hypothetical protein SAY86_015793 [Trapa natans]|uniref:Uncharacterized protein n=1 Tax=Trapa natans TaxID=22666 RepID=A0AAN7L977_TRANT|nr:hypothetical protein SAY86_015793 [Trapa natans]
MAQVRCLENRCSRRRRFLRCVSMALMLCLTAFIVGSTLVAVFEWRRSSSPLTTSSVSSISAAADASSCLSCSCRCHVKPHRCPHRPDYVKTQPNRKDLLDRIALLKEEIELLKTVARDSLKHTDAVIVALKRNSRRFQSEASKCRAWMETCEKGREMAEAEIVKERRLTKLWENRAREMRWRDNMPPERR